MNTFTFDPRARKISLDADNMWIELTDGRQLGVPLAYYPRLLKASQGQSEYYMISGEGSGIHGDKLDEDISVKSLLPGIGGRTQADRIASYPVKTNNR